MKKKFIVLIILASLPAICVSKPERVDVIIDINNCHFDCPDLSQNLNSRISDDDSLMLQQEVVDILKNKKRNIHQNISLETSFKNPYTKQIIALWLILIWTKDNKRYAIYAPKLQEKKPKISTEIAKTMMRYAGEKCSKWKEGYNIKDNKGNKTLNLTGSPFPPTEAVEIPWNLTALYKTLDDTLIIKGG